MLSEADRQTTRRIFGADDAQIERDHLISHVLAAVSHDVGEQVAFFGGTALARTFLTDGRLSEDLDLIALGHRTEVGEALARTITRHLARDFGRPTYSPSFTSTRGAEAVNVVFPSGPRLQIQLLPSDHYPAWPFERRELVQRYSDAGPANLLVPTFDAFVAWKTVTYMDRRAPRDLWDLAAIAEFRPFTPGAASLFAKFGPHRSLPTNATIPSAPDVASWSHHLAHQTRLTISAQQARDRVVRAWVDLEHASGTAVREQ